MALLKIKCKASTLLESLVAMVLIMICFGIAMMIYVNVMSSDNNRQKLSAQLLLNQVALEGKQEKKYLDEKIEAGNMTIQKTVAPYKEADNLSLLTLTAFDKNGKMIAQHKELIPMPKDVFNNKE